MWPKVSVSWIKKQFLFIQEKFHIPLSSLVAYFANNIDADQQGSYCLLNQ